MIRVVVADDQPAVRAGLVLILDSAPDISVVAEAADGDEAVRACRDLRPDVAVLDVRMPHRDGIRASADIVADGLADQTLPKLNQVNLSIQDERQSHHPPDSPRSGGLRVG